MYAYLNDLSVRPAGFSNEQILSLFNDFIAVFSRLKEYKIEKLRTPLGFKNNILFFGVTTLKDLIGRLAGENDYDIRTKIVTFLNNIEETRPPEHIEQLDQLQRHKLLEAFYENIPSDMLSEAFLLEYPIISFKSNADFETHFINCEILVLTIEHENRVAKRIPNFYSEDCITYHHELLLGIHHGLLFAEKKWDPFNNPSWRTEVTKKVLTLAKYPGNRSQISPTDLRSLNMNAAEAVLTANGWKYDHIVTGYNRNKAAIWRIYTNFLTNESIYISVDLGEGEFEMQDRKGRWKATRFFDGSPTGKDYTGENTHGIKVKN